MAKPLEPPPLEEIRAARERLRGVALRTPLVRLDAGPAGAEVWLKLESLQPIGSFKIRGAGNALALARPEDLARGVYTASAGNMAQGLAFAARRLGVPCAVVVPDTAPRAKLDAIERLGARYVKEPFERWWRVLVEHAYPGLDGLFVHPFHDPAVIAGNGTIGLEILEDLPDVDTILVPWGGGGLSCGIAAAVKAISPRVRVVACEVETAAPLSASLAAGSPQSIAYHASFVDGIGSGGLHPGMWALARTLLDGARVAKLPEVADAVRLLATRQRVVAEGAGATSVAVALSDRAPGGKTVCVVSGGNIDAGKLARILEGQTPEAPTENASRPESRSR